MQSNRKTVDNRFFILLTAGALGCAEAPTPDDVEETTAALRADSPAATELPATAAVEWVDLMMKTVADEKIGAPEAARLYGASTVAIYESVVDGIPGRRSLGQQLNGLPKLKHAPPGLHLDWPTVLARATGRLTTDLLSERPRAVAAVAALVDRQLAARAGVDEKVRRKSLDHGAQLGDTLVEWMRADGFLAHRNDPYTAPTGPGRWAPTGGAPATTRPAEPHFGSTRPMAMPSPEACSPGAPPAYSEEPGSPLHAQAQMVIDASYWMSEEQDALARYWADGNGTPGTPGHWVNIARDRLAGATLARAAEVLVTVGVTQTDAFISCWNTKYAFMHLRPETYIQKVIDPQWAPMLPTPQHPEHTSGHACSAGAGAEALAALFGDVPFVDETHAARGLGARRFDSFSAAAAEAAVSRLYTGHHFPSGSEAGVRGGRCVGRRFLDRVKLVD